jgi:hypothetical protein
MRLKGYLHLNEGVIEQGFTIMEFAKFVKRDCKPYLSIVKKLPHPFLRAMRPPHMGLPKKVGPDDVDDFLEKYKGTEIGSGIGLMAVRQDRTPRLTPKKAFENTNDWLQSKGGARRDKSAIAISKMSVIHKTFGDPHWIFPVGKFKYSFVMSQDFNITDGFWDPREFFEWMDDYEDRWSHDPEVKEYWDEKDEKFSAFFYHNTHAEKAFREEWEIWFQCPKYYFINIEHPHIPRLVKTLKMIWNW